MYVRMKKYNKNAIKHLNKHGVFIFDFYTKNKLKEIKILYQNILCQHPLRQ